MDLANDDDLLCRASTPAGDGIVLSLDGGQLLSWVCDGRERLFVSAHAVGGPGRSVRGGVPVIFPQFGLFGPGPKHGFARLQRWQPAIAGSEGAVAAELRDSEATRAAWPHRFRLRVLAQCTDHSLAITLSVHNEGDEAFEFTGGLHTYLAVEDVARCRLDGLEGRSFLDCAGGGRVPRIQGPEPLYFAGEVDRVYAGTDELLLSSPGVGVGIAARAFTDTVVWNPGAGLAAAITDLGVEQQPGFACVESAVVGSPVRLEPGAAWHGVQHLAITAPHPSFQTQCHPLGDPPP